MSTTQTSGARIKLARSMLGLSRKQFEALYQISANTMQAWESDKYLLTIKGAKKLNETFTKLGLLCSEEWLLTGKGTMPIFMHEGSIPPDDMNEDICIMRELEVFKAINPDPIVVVVNDNGMEPIYCIGDFIGGNKRYGDEISQLISAACIIETMQGDTLIRKLLKANKPNMYNLACTNIATDQQPIIPDIKIRFAARIVLHRKKDL